MAMRPTRWRQNRMMFLPMGFFFRNRKPWQEHQEVQQALHQHLPVSQLREPHQRIQNGDAPHPVAAEQDDEQRYEVGDAQQHQHPPTDPFFQKQIDDGGTANDGQEQHSYVNYHIQETLMSNQQNHVHEEMVI